MSAQAGIGVIGGSGFYSFLEDAEEMRVETPFGPPSEHPVVGTVTSPSAGAGVAGRRVAFVPRHGRDHRFPPHRVNYRANLWALRAVGVRQVLAPCAVGSLRPELGPGTVVVPDQVVDRTWGREHTVYDGVHERAGHVVHVSFADPFCPSGRGAVLEVAAGGDEPATDGGTLVVVNGPRFSSRAESRWHAAAGWSLVGMTTMPEAAVARELAMCFTTIALVTDHDAGVEGGEAVTHAEVLEVFGRNVERLKDLVRGAVTALPEEGTPEAEGCACRHALDGIALPFDLP
jgi:5'-methylthioadenosine phosphorylase